VRKRRLPALLAIAAVLSAAPAAWGLRQNDAGGPEEWFRRIHVRGNADVAVLAGQENSLASGGRVLPDNARLFLEADLGRDLAAGGTLIAEDASFLVEMNFVHREYAEDRIGSLYVRLDGLLGVGALNLKIGRFLVPFGEEYLRFSEGRPENPLISFSTAEPYGWDEGVLLFGSVLDERLAWFLSATNGDADFFGTAGAGLAVSGKIRIRPLPGLELSASALRTGRLGDEETSAEGAFQWSGVSPEPFGYGSSTQNFADGAPVTTDPERRLKDVRAGEVDLVCRSGEWGSLWLGAGAVTIFSRSSSFYTRRLRYGVAEAVVELGALSPDLDPFYLALRGSIIGTFDSDRGYFLGAFNDGEELGYNVRDLTVVTLGAGVRVSRSIVFKIEFSWTDVDLVRGVTPDLESAARRRSYGGIGVSIHF